MVWKPVILHGQELWALFTYSLSHASAGYELCLQRQQDSPGAGLPLSAPAERVGQKEKAASHISRIYSASSLSHRNGYPDAQYLCEVGTVLNKLGLV